MDGVALGADADSRELHYPPPFADQAPNLLRGKILGTPSCISGYDNHPLPRAAS